MKTLITAVALALASVTSFAQTVASTDSIYPHKDRAGRESGAVPQTGALVASTTYYTHSDRMGRESPGLSRAATGSAAAERPATHRPQKESRVDRPVPKERWGLTGLVPPEDAS